MIATAFDEHAWIPYTLTSGEMPVAEGTLVDVKYRDGKKTAYGVPCGENVWDRARDAGGSFWRCDEQENDIVAWRLHKPSLANPVKENLAKETPVKQPDVFVDVKPSALSELDGQKPKKSVSDNENTILSAFGALTGVILTDDQFNTLKILINHFQD